MAFVHSVPGLPESKCSHVRDMNASVRFISAAGLLNLGFQSLQCQSYDSWHAAVE